MSAEQTPAALLTHNLPEFWRRVDDRHIRNTVRGFRDWYLSARIPDGMSNEIWQHQQLCRFVAYEIGDIHNLVVELHQRYGQFASQVQRGATEQEQWQHQEGFLQYLGCSKRQIKRDKAAKQRWFGNDAIKDRYQNKAAEYEYRLCFLLQRLGQLIQLYGQTYSSQETEVILKALGLQTQLMPLLRYEGDERVAVQAMACLRVAFDHLGDDILATLDPALTQQAYRTASDPYLPVWLQTEALAVLFNLDKGSVSRLLMHRLGNTAAPADDLFFRARALQILFLYRQRISSTELETLVELVLDDSSILVRQQLAERISQLPESLMPAVFERLAQEDSSPQVKGTAWLSLENILAVTPNPEYYLERYYRALADEQESHLLRLLLELAPTLFNQLADERSQFYDRTHDLLSQIHTTHEQTRVRRWAAQAREQLWQQSRRVLDADSERSLQQLALSQSVKIQCPDLPDADLGRHLAALSQRGFGFDVQRFGGKLKIRGGYKLGFRLWRFMHEWLHPATDKRQNYNHTVGRIFFGRMQAPPRLLAESSETKVPGEPLLMDGEEGWRPYLPLVDQILSSLDQGWPTRPVKLYTSEGITEIMPPRSLPRRLWARFHIVRRFKHLAGLRNWQEKSDNPPQAYLQALAKLGFSFRIYGYEDKQRPLPVDPRVAQFFPAVLPFYSLAEFWRELQNYFYSVYQNTIQQLSIFLVAIAALFLGQHFWSNMRFRRARNALPYVIGGWGTRGKSGTERLKAALLNGSGISLVSKSSGCEAQFLYAPAQRELRELFLFRPYDKASIWEQTNIVRLAAKLDAQVFLWECMGLTPRYIEILQQQWMRDDLSTITNCYPDHEDIQGPAGIDIPKVMMRFVPRNATLITSEDSMSPLLESAARSHGSQYHQVTWRDAFLLAPDVLQRFPYEEHPTNIALVLKMAGELGFPADQALKAMADHVVPDLGVLKVYPQSRIRDRGFIFINGMSANERFAALGNWQRLELDRITPGENPDIWLTTVVNNRADRIARSRVFARMLVDDLSADAHFLIGTNLDGLRKYIEEAWQERVGQLNLEAKEARERDKLLSGFIELCQFMRLVIDEQQAQLRIQAMLEGIGLTEGEHVGVYWQTPGALEAALVEIDEDHRQMILAYTSRAQHEIEGFRLWRERIADARQPVDAQALCDQLWQWYWQRFVVIEDIHATGNAVINSMIANTPPGLCNKMIGLQNIKGTGLDFIYRWQTWDNTHRLCQQLNSSSARQAENAAKALANVSDFGLLDEYLVSQTCQAVRDKKIAQTELFQAELSVIQANLARQLRQIGDALDNSSEQSTLIDRLISSLEAFLDPGNAVRRRKTAERIYQDLADQRISVERAVVELQRLNKEQKGGWLRQRLLRG